MNKLIYPILAALLCCFSSYAQESTQVRADTLIRQSLAGVTIHENRLQIPFAEQNRNVTILDKAVIQSLPVKSVNELLAYVAGIDVRQRGPWGIQTDIGIDGGTFDQTLVLLNGIKLSDPQTGHNMMNIPIALDAIERIEILKGAAASVYGINAINGAINIITRQPDDTGVSVDLHGGTSFARDSSTRALFASYGLSATASLAGSTAQHLLSLSHQQGSGYRYNTAFSNEKVYYQNTLALGGGTVLHMLGGFVYNDFGANGFYAAPGDVESKETVQTAIAGVDGVIPVSSRWTVRPRISYRYNHDDYIFVRQKPEVYWNKHETEVLDAELNNTIRTGIGVFGIGVELRQETINSNNLGKWGRMNYGFFGEYSFREVEHLMINIGAYVNYNSDFGWQLLPGIDVGYQLTRPLRFFASAGMGERLPTFTDLYYQGPSNIGNADLQPEKAFHLEGGLKYTDSRLNASLSYFYRNTSEFIDWVKDSLEQPWQPQNFQQIKTPGISFSGDYRLWDPEVNRAFSLLAGLSYTWLNPKAVKKEAGNMISHYALENLRNQLCVRASVDFRKKIQLTLAARYEQRVNYKDYTLLDARLAYILKQFAFYGAVTNIADVAYIEAGAVPMPGRWITMGIKWNWWK